MAYEKLPTPYEGGHVRIRQILSWSCRAGHRVILAHRDAKAPKEFSSKWEALPAKMVRDLDIGSTMKEAISAVHTTWCLLSLMVTMTSVVTST